MALAKVEMVCYGTAFALHAFTINLILYGTEKESTNRSCQPMMNVPFFMYGFAFLASLFRGLDVDTGCLDVTTRTALAVIGGIKLRLNCMTGKCESIAGQG